LKAKDLEEYTKSFEGQLLKNYEYTPSLQKLISVNQKKPHYTVFRVYISGSAGTYVLEGFNPWRENKMVCHLKLITKLFVRGIISLHASLVLPSKIAVFVTQVHVKVIVVKKTFNTAPCHRAIADVLLFVITNHAH
jgi:hypothetical protein